MTIKLIPARMTGMTAALSIQMPAMSRRRSWRVVTPAPALNRADVIKKPMGCESPVSCESSLKNRDGELNSLVRAWK